MSIFLTPFGERRKSGVVLTGKRKVKRESSRDIAIALKNERTREQNVLEDFKLVITKFAQGEENRYIQFIENLPHLRHLNGDNLAAAMLIRTRLQLLALTQKSTGSRSKTSSKDSYIQELNIEQSNPLAMLLDDNMIRHFVQRDIIILPHNEFINELPQIPNSRNADKDEVNDIIETRQALIFLRELDSIMTEIITTTLTLPETNSENEKALQMARNKASLMRYLRLIAIEDQANSSS